MMNKTIRFWLYPLLIIGFVLIVFNSCKKDNEFNLSETVTDVDGNVYKTVTIGTQVWMAENLKVAHYCNGDSIHKKTDAIERVSYTTGAYCDYDYTPGNSAIYGKLYNWYSVADSRKIAPEGWHVPSNEEWITLENYLIANGYNFDETKTEDKIAKSLASTTGWELFDVAGTIGAYPEGNNSTGFKALPGGFRNSNGNFNYIGANGYWWSSTGHGTDDAYLRYLSFSSIILGEFYNSKKGCMSVRCVKD